jgi:hypothetical protein
MSYIGKVAVLISGPIRTFHSVWPHNIEILKRHKYDYEFFLHTWDTDYPNHKNLFSGGTLDYIFKFHPVKIEKHSVLVDKNMFPSDWNTRIQSFKKFTDSVKYLGLLSEKNLHESPTLRINSLAMYYGMTQVGEMAKESKIDFDYFLRVRTDFKLPKKDFFKNASSLRMHAKGVSINGYGISDICFGGPYDQFISSMISFESLTEKIARQGWVSPETGLGRYAENWLYEHLKTINSLDSVSNNIWGRKGQIVRGNLVRDFDKTFLEFQYLAIVYNLKRLNKNLWRKAAILKSSYTSKKIINFLNLFKR